MYMNLYNAYAFMLANISMFPIIIEFRVTNST